MKRDIKGYEGIYKISSTGKGWSVRNKKYLKPHFKNGYLRVELNKDNVAKKFLIHRLVAEAFIENPNGYTDVDHIDNNRKNNRVSNLQFISHRDNLLKVYVSGARSKRKKRANVK